MTSQIGGLLFWLTVYNTYICYNTAAAADNTTATTTTTNNNNN